MGGSVLQCFIILFILYFFLSSGSSLAEKPPPEAIQNKEITGYQEKQIIFSSSASTSQLDTTPGTIPIVNPSPTTATPTVNPTPPAPTTPTVNPTPPAPTTTEPTTTPNPVPTPTTTTPASSGGSWCIASPAASETALQVALDYACGYGAADCSAIQAGASCYQPNTVHDHASYAFNDYYQKNPAPTSCVFGGTAQVTNTDPSNGNCHYASSTTTPTPPSISSPVTPTPLTPMTPTTTMPGGGSTVPTYGVAEPTGLPSSATFISCSSLLLFTATGFVGSLLAEIYL